MLFTFLGYHVTCVQRCTITTFPGWVNMGWKNCALLPVVGKQNTTFSLNVTHPRNVPLVQPCTEILEWGWTSTDDPFTVTCSPNSRGWGKGGRAGAVKQHFYAYGNVEMGLREMVTYFRQKGCKFNPSSTDIPVKILLLLLRPLVWFRGMKQQLSLGNGK